MMNIAQNRPIYLGDLYVYSVTCSVPVGGLVYVFWESVLPSIVNRRAQHSLDCFLHFLNSEPGLILCIGHKHSIHHYPLGSCGPFQENYACNMPYHNP